MGNAISGFVYAKSARILPKTYVVGIEVNTMSSVVSQDTESIVAGWITPIQSATQRL